jgi:hypothetical protein
MAPPPFLQADGPLGTLAEGVTRRVDGLIGGLRYANPPYALDCLAKSRRESF